MCSGTTIARGAIARGTITPIPNQSREHAAPAAARGDPAWQITDLITSIIPGARRYARSLARRSGEDAEDLVQSALELLWRRLRRDPEEEIIAGRYLFACIRNLHQNRMRQQHPLLMALPEMEHVVRPDDPERSYGDLLDRSWMLAAVPGSDRDLLLLYASGFTSIELSRLYQCRHSAMKMRLKRAGDRLRRSGAQERSSPRCPELSAGELLARARHLIQWAELRLLQPDPRA